MTEHPEELLAEYVDGELSPEQRARVDVHVADCPVCSEEVVRARFARAALTSLPELDAPPGIELAVRRKTRGRSRVAWRAAGVAAAAAVIAAGAVVVLSDGQQEAGLEAGGGGGGAPATAAPRAPGGAMAEDAQEAGGGGETGFAAARVQVPTYSESGVDYGSDDLALLGRRFRVQAGATLQDGLSPTAEGFYRDFELAAFTSQVREAVRCVIQDVPPDQLVVPLAIEVAAFEGQPAYVAAFLEGPAPDQPYDKVLIWVVDRQTCTLRTFATQSL